MTEEQGDKIIELLQAISNKLGEVTNGQERLEVLLEPWQMVLNEIATNTVGAVNKRASI